MNGRKEIDLKNEKWIENKLHECPAVLNDYMLSTEKTKTSWSRRNYLGYLIQFIGYLKDNGINVDDVNEFNKIKPLDINKYMKYIGYRNVNGNIVENKAGIKAAKLFAISHFFEFMLKNDLVNKNPCDRVEVPKDKVEKEIVSLTTDEIKTIQNNIINRGKGRGKKYNTRDLCIVTLGVSTGLRVSAIAEINISDIDFENNVIKVTEKGDVEREIIIGEKTKQLIRKWISEREVLMKGHAQTDALFISKNKTRMTTVAIGDMLRKDSANINKHVTPHKMRSTCATNLYEATGDIYLVQEQLGHANISNTRRYAKVSQEKKALAAKVLNDIV